MEELQKRVEQKIPIAPYQWMETAEKINALLGTEQETLFDLEQKIAQKRLMLYNSQEKPNVSAVKMQLEASYEFREARSQRAKIDRAIEFIRLAKKHATLADAEYKSSI